MSETELHRWPRVPLGQLATLIMGQAPPGADCNESGKGMPFVRAGEFGVERPTISQWTTRPLRTAKETDVLICVVGATSGKINLGADCAIGRSVAAIRPKEAILDPKYLYSFLKTRVVPLREASSGSAQGVIQRDLLEKEMIPLPSIQEQRRVVERLESLLAKKSRSANCLTLVPPLLDRLRQSILAAAFRGDLTADWRARNPDVEPADMLLEKIRSERRLRWEEAELARLTAKGKPPSDDRWKERYPEPGGLDDPSLPTLPAGWVWASAEACAYEITVGHVGPMKDEYITHGVPFLRSQNVRENRFDSKEIKYISRDFHARLEKSALSPGDVVVVRSGAPGTACVVPPELGESNCSDLVIVRPSGLLDPWFLSYFLNSNFAKQRVLDLQVGVAQQHFNVGAMKVLPVPATSLQEQVLTVARIRRAFGFIATIETSLRTLNEAQASLDAAILAKAFRGELVPQDSNDEPASVLLDRLRAEAGVSPAKTGRRTRTTIRSDSPTSPKSENATSPPTLAPIARAEPVGASVEAVPGRAFVTAIPPVQQTLHLATPVSDFLDLPAEAQTTQVHNILLGEGPLEREDAVRCAAELLRDAGQASFQRLRRDGTLATCIDAALAVGLRQAHFDRPRPGTVRALAREPGKVPPALWRRALLAALAEPTADDDAAVRAAAAWSQAQFGLDFQRLRTGGHIDTALRAALADLLATGEVTRDRQGTLRVRSG